MNAVRSQLRFETATVRYATCELSLSIDESERATASKRAGAWTQPNASAALFLDALDLFQAALEKYSPDEQRVPGGNGIESGRWTRGDGDAGESSDTTHNSSGSHDGSVQVASSDREKPAWLGRAPNDQHDAGVKQAIQDESARGYDIYLSTPLAVTIPGFATPRLYDFIAINPATGNLIGVEVKTTQFETISLDPTQVAKDIALMENGGAPLAVGGRFVKGIDYIVTCKDCEAIDIRSTVLQSALKRANVNFVYSRFSN